MSNAEENDSMLRLNFQPYLALNARHEAGTFMLCLRSEKTSFKITMATQIGKKPESEHNLTEDYVVWFTP